MKKNNLLRQIKVNIANMQNSLGFMNPNENPVIVANKIAGTLHQTQSCLFAIASFIEKLETRLKTLENGHKNY